MKKILVFIAGFLLGPALLLGGILFYSQQNKTPPQPTNTTIDPTTVGINLSEEHVVIQGTLGLPFPELAKNFPPKPWYFYAVLMPSKVPLGTVPNKFQFPLAEFPLDSFPQKFLFPVPRDAWNEITGEAERSGDPSLYMVIIACDQECSNNNSLLWHLSMAPYFLGGDLRIPLTKAMLTPSLKSPVDLGDVYFRDLYIAKGMDVYGANQSKIFEKCNGKQAKLKLIDHKNYLAANAADKNLHILRVPDGFYVAKKDLGSRYASSKADELFEEVATISERGKEMNFTIKQAALPDPKVYAHYYLLMCGKSEKKEGCLAEFTKNYYKDRALDKPGHYYRLVAKDLLMPRCDMEELTLYFHPNRVSFMEHHQFPLKMRDSSAPKEIIDSDGESGAAK